MACSGCRQPKEIRKPTVTRTPTKIVPTGGQNNNTSGSTGGQRSRVTGLTYVPK